jgi:hypothetical protein
MFPLFSSALSPADRARLRRVERKLDLLLAHLNVPYDEALAGGLSSEVRNLADQGRKIEAIKLHRQLTGSSLVDAKTAVEDYMNRS